MIEDIKFSDIVKFKPWVGENYKQGFRGKKLLILGDSHYCEADKNRNAVCQENWLKNKKKCAYDCMDCNCYEMTRDLMRKQYLPYRRGEEKYCKEFRSHLCFEKIIFGEATVSNNDAFAFWNSVAFYNYAQHSQSGTSKAMEHPDAAPLYKEALYEVLEKLKPSHIIVWSKRCYDLLPIGIADDEDIIVGDYSTKFRKYNINGDIVKAVGISHPSRAGQVEWHTLLKAFFKL